MIMMVKIRVTVKMTLGVMCEISKCLLLDGSVTLPVIKKTIFEQSFDDKTCFFSSY